MAHSDSPSRRNPQGYGRSSVMGSAANSTLPPGATRRSSRSSRRDGRRNGGSTRRTARRRRGPRARRPSRSPPRRARRKCGRAPARVVISSTKFGSMSMAVTSWPIRGQSQRGVSPPRSELEHTALRGEVERPDDVADGDQMVADGLRALRHVGEGHIRGRLDVERRRLVLGIVRSSVEPLVELEDGPPVLLRVGIRRHLQVELHAELREAAAQLVVGDGLRLVEHRQHLVELIQGAHDDGTTVGGGGLLRVRGRSRWLARRRSHHPVSAQRGHRARLRRRHESRTSHARREAVPPPAGHGLEAGHQSDGTSAVPSAGAAVPGAGPGLGASRARVAHRVCVPRHAERMVRPLRTPRCPATPARRVASAPGPGA